MTRVWGKGGRAENGGGLAWQGKEGRREHGNGP